MSHEFLVVRVVRVVRRFERRTLSEGRRDRSDLDARRKLVVLLNRQCRLGKLDCRCRFGFRKDAIPQRRWCGRSQVLINGCNGAIAASSPNALLFDLCQFASLDFFALILVVTQIISQSIEGSQVRAEIVDASMHRDIRDTKGRWKLRVIGQRGNVQRWCKRSDTVGFDGRC